LVSRVQLDLATKRSPTHSKVPSLDLWLHLGAADLARLEIFPHIHTNSKARVDTLDNPPSRTL
jgi:hypothetical protein